MRLGTRERPAVALAGLLLALVPLALSGPATGALVHWDVQIWYDVDPEAGEVTLRDPHAGGLPAIDCQVPWEVGFSGMTGSVPWEDHYVVYFIDYQDAEILIWERTGTVIETVEIRCPDPVLRAPGLALEWQEAQVDPAETGASCQGPSDASIQGLAPLSTSGSDSTLHALETPVPCVKARGATSTGPAGSAPLTGEVTAVLTDDLGSEIKVATCTMVAGSCWGSGPGWSSSVAQALGERTWTLTCQADTLFGLPLPTAGTFGCGAWFD